MNKWSKTNRNNVSKIERKKIHKINTDSDKTLDVIKLINDCLYDMKTGQSKITQRGKKNREMDGHSDNMLYAKYTQRNKQTKHKLSWMMSTIRKQIDTDILAVGFVSVGCAFNRCIEIAHGDLITKKYLK